MDWNRAVDAEDVREGFKLILRRDVGNDTYPAALEEARVPFSTFIDGLVVSDEFAELHTRRAAAKAIANGAAGGFVAGIGYRNPQDFRVTPQDPSRVLLIGSCLMSKWEPILGEIENSPRLTLLNVLDVPPMSAEEAAGFDYQIIQIPIREVLPEGLVYGIAADDEAGFAQAFDIACERLARTLENALRVQRDHGLPAFCLNFLLPQQNLMGRMAPRYALSNPVFFVEELNRRLAALLAGRPGVHLVDFDQIVATLGRRYFQDDLTIHSNHGSMLGPLAMGADAARLEPIGDVEALYGLGQWEYIVALYREIENLYRSVRQVDTIKIVIFDLDDTLWRGVAADSQALDWEMSEGWPLGIVEALSYLWRRGVLLAIVSKNDEEVATRTWDRLYGKVFPIENFVVRKINWEPKAKNVEDILASVNLLSRNALFVDDNPVERAQVKAAFPEIRLMDAPLAAWRRLLLWSPELQTATFTQEGAQRTAMIQRQIEREVQRGAGDRSEFLASLALEIAPIRIDDEQDPRFARCYELLNKTNQFNTTGRRWAPAEMSTLLRDGGSILALSATDRFTAYGIVAVAVLAAGDIVQVVMSCRVFGMGVEHALMSLAVARAVEGGAHEIHGEIVPTDRNRLSLDLFAACGFAPAGDGRWTRRLDQPLPLPSHIRVVDGAEHIAA